MAKARTKPLRTLAAPFVVARPTGTSIRTSIRATDTEAEALTAIGTHLGQLFRRDVKARMRLGLVTAKQRDESRAERKRALTAQSSSRWAGAITRAAEDQYQLGMRALYAEQQHLADALATLDKRLAAPVPGQSGIGAARVKDGYRTLSERHQKARRRAQLADRKAGVDARVSAAHPRIVIGGGRLLSVRSNLAQAGMTETRWREQWDANRMFLTADGESGKRFGNETIRVTSTGTLTLKVPAPLVPTYGTHLTIASPVQFHNRVTEHADRVTADRAVAYTISYDPTSDRWYLTASWGYKDDAPEVPLAALQAGTIIGVDMNADHLAVSVIDSTGNPVGTPHTIPLDVHGLPASTVDGHLRDAISALIRFATDHGAGAIAIENLNFQDARSTGRETMGRGRRGKTFRRTVAGMPTGKFRDRLTAMAANRGIALIAVDPAYTSQWGAQHWQKPLQTNTSRTTVTGHMAAAVAIGRRAHGHAVRRRPDGPRSRQRMSASPRPAPRSNRSLTATELRPSPARAASTRRARTPETG